MMLTISSMLSITYVFEDNQTITIQGLRALNKIAEKYDCEIEFKFKDDYKHRKDITDENEGKFITRFSKCCYSESKQNKWKFDKEIEKIRPAIKNETSAILGGNVRCIEEKW